MTASRIIATTLMVLVLTTAVPAIAQFDDAFVKDTKTYLERLEKLGFAGSVMITVEGKPILAEGYGDAQRNPSIKWTPQTVSTTGSITKQFTAAAIMRLQEQGKLDVYDTLDKHFKDVPADKAGITIHHLLAHSSGIGDPPVSDFDENSRDGYVRLVLEQPLNAEPGEQFEYANANYSLAGAIIEQVMDTNYETAMRELIFKPAGLEQTGYTMPNYDESVLAYGYDGDERWGTIFERPMADDGPYWALRANGGIYSNAVEMTRWGQVLLDNKVLTAESREAMWTPHIDESNSGDAEFYYAYGWGVTEPEPGMKIITHNGGNGILFADMAIIPQFELVAFVQTNVIATFRTTNDLLEQMSARAMGEPYPDVPVVVDASPDELDAWTGTYTLGENDRIEVTSSGSALRVTPHGWSAYAAVHSMPSQDTKQLVAMSSRAKEIVGAFLEGNYQPLFDAYQGRVPLERLEELYSERLAQRETEYGALQGFNILGTSTGDQYHFTIVQYQYANEVISRTYVWDLEDTSNLLGITSRRMDPSCNFYPVKGGGFQSWDPSTGASVKADLKKDGSDALFIVARDSEQVELRR